MNSQSTFNSYALGLIAIQILQRFRCDTILRLGVSFAKTSGPLVNLDFHVHGCTSDLELKYNFVRATLVFIIVCMISFFLLVELPEGQCGFTWQSRVV